MSKLFLHFQQQKHHFDLPEQWRLSTFAALEDRIPPGDVIDATREALKTPVQHDSLATCLKGSETIAVLIEDSSRSSPKQQVLRGLLDELLVVGIPRHRISIVIALGTHRQLGSSEMASVYGKDLVDSYEFINHDCTAKDLVPIGSLSSGTSVKINRRVYEADFIIGIGSIFPHPMNGFGGGGKILFPAVANFDAILEHHLKYCFRGNSRLGQLDGNPFYEEICMLARAGGLNFIINSVLDHNDLLYQVVCGEPVAAHNFGVQISRRILSMPFEGKSDVTMISAFPYTEGTQIMKPLAPASEITRIGGTVILAADCSVPLPKDYLAGCHGFRQKHSGRLKEAVFELFDNNQRIMEDGAPEFNMSMAQALLGQNDYRIILVSKDIPEQTAHMLGFDYAPELHQAIAMAASRQPEANVHVVPAGGVILPVVGDG
jgi:nickel-dependent lactate racemase